MDARNDYSLSSFIACHAFPTRVASALPGVTTACLSAWKRSEYRAEMRVAWKLPLKKKRGKRRGRKYRRTGRRTKDDGRERRTKAGNVGERSRENTKVGKGNTRFEEKRSTEGAKRSRRGNGGRRNGRTARERSARSRRKQK